MDGVPRKEGTLGKLKTRVLFYLKKVFYFFKHILSMWEKRNWLSVIIQCILIVFIIIIAFVMLYSIAKDIGFQYSLTKAWFHMNINYKEIDGMGAVSFSFSIVALSNTVLNFLSSERGRYGFNQFELLSLSISRRGMIFLQTESILCAFLSFFAYIFHWYHIEYAGIVGCVISVFLLVFLWMFTASERFSKKCICSIVWRDCVRRKKNKNQILAADLYRPKEIKDIFGRRIHRLMNQARLTDRYTLSMIMESSFRAIGKIADCKYKREKKHKDKEKYIKAYYYNKEYYYRKIYSMVFIFLDMFHKNVGCNSTYRENLNQIIQDVPEANQNFWGSVRFGIVSAVFYAICQQMNTYQRFLKHNENILSESEFWEYGKAFFRDCIIQNREYMIADIYMFLEIYFYEDKIPDPIIELLAKYKVDYGAISENIKNSEKLYQYCFSELYKMENVKNKNAEIFAQVLIEDMDSYISKSDWYCKSNIMSKIQIRRLENGKQV